MTDSKCQHQASTHSSCCRAHRSSSSACTVRPFAAAHLGSSWLQAKAVAAALTQIVSVATCCLWQETRCCKVDPWSAWTSQPLLPLLRQLLPLPPPLLLLMLWLCLSHRLAEGRLSCWLRTCCVWQQLCKLPALCRPSNGSPPELKVPAGTQEQTHPHPHPHTHTQVMRDSHPERQSGCFHCCCCRCWGSCW